MLSEAIKNRDEKALVALLAQGANPNQPNRWGSVPLHMAAQQGATGCVRILLGHGANPNVRNMWMNTPLEMAVGRGHTDIVELLLEHGAGVRGIDPILHLAAIGGYEDIFRTLLRHGAPLRTRDFRGRTLLEVPHGSHEMRELVASCWIKDSWSRFVPRARAIRTIQTHWIRAYWDPRYRVCQDRLHRNFAALTAAH